MAHSATYIKIMNSKEWRDLRNQKRQTNPYCEECLKEGIVSPMHAVHHIREIESGRTEAEQWQLALSWNNLQSLCAEHHRSAHVGSHTKAAHLKRATDRLASWKAKQQGETPPPFF